MEKVLTITVPAYNVERFLDQTLASFADERVLELLEVLVVDDGSKDRTADIAKGYEERYPHTFRLISKENGGHGSTINRGIQEASGKYFKVVDGDDWVDTDGLCELILRLQTCNTDYVFTNYYDINDTDGKKTPVTYPNIPKGTEMAFESIAGETRISMHALAIRTEILKSHTIRLDEHCFYVDVEYILYPIPYVNTVIYFDTFVYMYRLAQVNQSVSIKGFQKHIQNHIDVILHVLDHIEAYGKSKDADRTKLEFMERRIADMVNDQTDIFMSFPSGDKDILRRFKEFDAEVRRKSQRVYERSGELSKTLRLLRSSGFRLYKPAVWLSRIKRRD